MEFRGECFLPRLWNILHIQTNFILLAICKRRQTPSTTPFTNKNPSTTPSILDWPAGQGCAEGWRKVVSPFEGKRNVFRKIIKLSKRIPKQGQFSGILKSFPGFSHSYKKIIPFLFTARHLTLRGLHSVFPWVLGISSAFNKKISRKNQNSDFFGHISKI